MAEGRKDDHGKRPWWLLPVRPINEILDVLNWAAFEKKPPYGPHNWKGVPSAYERYYSACMRHMTDFWERHERGYDREDMKDGESGFHILAHACCCIIFLLWFELVGAQKATVPKALCPRCEKNIEEHTYSFASTRPVCPDVETNAP